MWHIAGGVFMALVAFEYWKAWRTKRIERRFQRRAMQILNPHVSIAPPNRGGWFGAWAALAVLVAGVSFTAFEAWCG